MVASPPPAPALAGGGVATVSFLLTATERISRAANGIAEGRAVRRSSGCQRKESRWHHPLARLRQGLSGNPGPFQLFRSKEFYYVACLLLRDWDPLDRRAARPSAIPHARLKILTEAVRKKPTVATRPPAMAGDGGCEATLTASRGGMPAGRAGRIAPAVGSRLGNGRKRAPGEFVEHRLQLLHR